MGGRREVVLVEEGHLQLEEGREVEEGPVEEVDLREP